VRSFIALLIVTVVLACAPASQAAIKLYDASLNTLPAAQGFIDYNDGPNAPTVSGGLLHVTNYPTNNDSIGTYSYGNDLPFSFASFALEARLQIINSSQRSGPGLGNYPRAGFALEAWDSTSRYLGVMISSTGLWIQTGDGITINPVATAFYTFNTTDAFHTYRLEADGSTADLFIDGSASPVLSFNLANAGSFGSPNLAYFGDTSILARSSFDLDYFFYSGDITAVIPTPAALPAGLTLLALATTHLSRRRRIS
jgi:hypothetical protein